MTGKEIDHRPVSRDTFGRKIEEENWDPDWKMEAAQPGNGMPSVRGAVDVRLHVRTCGYCDHEEPFSVWWAAFFTPKLGETIYFSVLEAFTVTQIHWHVNMGERVGVDIVLR